MPGRRGYTFVPLSLLCLVSIVSITHVSATLRPALVTSPGPVVSTDGGLALTAPVVGDGGVLGDALTSGVVNGAGMAIPDTAGEQVHMIWANASVGYGSSEILSPGSSADEDTSIPASPPTFAFGTPLPGGPLAHYLESSGFGETLLESLVPVTNHASVGSNWALVGPEGRGRDHCGPLTLAGGVSTGYAPHPGPGTTAICTVPSPVGLGDGGSSLGTSRPAPSAAPSDPMVVVRRYGLSGVVTVGAAVDPIDGAVVLLAFDPVGSSTLTIRRVPRESAAAVAGAPPPATALPLPAIENSMVLEDEIMPAEGAVAVSASTRRVWFLATNITAGPQSAPLLGAFESAMAGSGFMGWNAAPHGAVSLAGCGTGLEPCAFADLEVAVSFSTTTAAAVYAKNGTCPSPGDVGVANGSASANSSSEALAGVAIQGTIPAGTSVSVAAFLNGSLAAPVFRNVSCVASDSTDPSNVNDNAYTDGDVHGACVAPQADRNPPGRSAFMWGTGTVVGVAESWYAGVTLDDSAVSDATDHESPAAIAVAVAAAMESGAGAGGGTRVSAAVPRLAPTGAGNDTLGGATEIVAPSKGEIWTPLASSFSTSVGTWFHDSQAPGALGAVSVNAPVYSAPLSFISYVPAGPEYPATDSGWFTVRIVRNDGAPATQSFPGLRFEARMVHNVTGLDMHQVGFTDMGNGTFRVDYNTTDFGFYDLFVWVDGTAIGNSGEEQVEVTLGEVLIPADTWWSYPPLYARVPLGNTSFTAQFVSNVRNVTWSPPELVSSYFEVWYNATAGPGPSTEMLPNVSWIDNGDGTMSVLYTAGRPGLYEVRGSINGVEVVKHVVTGYRGWNESACVVTGEPPVKGEFYVGSEQVAVRLVDEYGDNATETMAGVSVRVSLVPRDNATAAAVAAALNVSFTPGGGGPVPDTLVVWADPIGFPTAGHNGTWLLNLTSHVPGLYTMTVEIVSPVPYPWPSGPLVVPLDGFPRDVEVLSDVPGIALHPLTDPAPAGLDESGPTEVTFMLKLANKPRAASVTLLVSGVVDARTGLAQAVPAPGNETIVVPRDSWKLGIPVTVRAVADNREELDLHTATVEHVFQSGSGDPWYGPGLAVEGVNVTLPVVDGDTAAIVVSPGAGPFAVLEGSTFATITLRLATEPYADVNVTLTVPGADVIIVPTMITFVQGSVSGALVDNVTSAHWYTDVTVSLIPFNDDFAEPVPETHVISMVATSDPQLDVNGTAIAGTRDEYYAGSYAPLGNVTASASVVITDDDTAGVFVTPVSGLVAHEDGSANDTFTVVCTARPAPGLQVVIATDGSLTPQLSSSPALLTFTSADWNVTQTVTVAAIDDTIGEDNPHATLLEPAIDTTGTTDPAFLPVTIQGVAVSVGENDPVNEIGPPIAPVFWDHDRTEHLVNWLSFASGNSSLPVVGAEVRWAGAGPASPSLVSLPTLGTHPLGAVLTGVNLTWTPAFGPAAIGVAAVEVRLLLSETALPTGRIDYRTAWVPVSFVVQALPAPAVTAVSPPGAPLAGGVTVDVYGSDLGVLTHLASNVTDITLAGVSCGATAVLVSKTHARCIAAPQPTAVSGGVGVTATHGAGAVTDPSVVSFAYVTPVVTAVVPPTLPRASVAAAAASGGVTITVHGDGLGWGPTDITSITVAGGVDCGNVVFYNASYVECTLSASSVDWFAGPGMASVAGAVPSMSLVAGSTPVSPACCVAGPVAGPVVVTSAISGAGTGTPLVTLQSPVVTAVVPATLGTRLPISGAAEVTITGHNFGLGTGDSVAGGIVRLTGGFDCIVVSATTNAAGTPGLGLTASGIAGTAAALASAPDEIVCAVSTSPAAAVASAPLVFNTTLGGYGAAAGPDASFGWTFSPPLSTVANLSKITLGPAGTVPVAGFDPAFTGPYIVTIDPTLGGVVTFAGVCLDPTCSGITLSIGGGVPSTPFGSGVPFTPGLTVPPGGSLTVTLTVTPEDPLAVPMRYTVTVTSPSSDARVVYQVTPASGDSGGGYVVVITGMGLGRSPGDVKAVSLAGVPCAEFVWVSPGEIRCTAARSPSGAKSGPAVVTIGSGTVDSSSPAAVFTYVYPRPVIDDARPRVVNPLGGTVVEVRGDFFGVADPTKTGEPVQLLIEGVPCIVTEWVSEKSLKCKTPAQADLPTGAPNLPLVARVGPRESNPTTVGFTKGFRYGIECNPVCEWNTECISGSCDACVPGFTGAPLCETPVLTVRAAGDGDRAAITSEDGDTARVSVLMQYNGQLGSSVVLQFSSSDTTEADVSTTTLTLTAADLGVEKFLDIVPKRDEVRDGNVTYRIVPKLTGGPQHFLLGPQPHSIVMRNEDMLPKIDLVTPELIPLAGRRATITGRHFDLYFALDVGGNPVGDVSRVRNGSLYITSSMSSLSPSAVAAGAPNVLQADTLDGVDVVEGNFPARTEGYHTLTLVNDVGSRATATVFYTDDCPEPGSFGRGIDCAPCPTGAVCPGGYRVRPTSGYWSPREDSGYVVRCEPLEACLGYDPVLGVALCAAGYTGDACSKCVEGFTKVVGGKCEPCPAQSEQTIMISADAIMWIMFALSAAWIEDTRKLSHVMQLILTLQMIGQIGKMVSSNLPGWLLLMYKGFRLFSGEIDFVSPDCYGNTPFEPKFFYSLAYLIIIGMPMHIFIPISGYFSKRRFKDQGYEQVEQRKQRYRERRTRAFHMHLVVIYLPLAALVASALTCTPFGGDGMRLLADPTVVCYKGTMIIVHAVAAFFAVTIMLGFPVWYFSYVRKHKELAFGSRTFRNRHDVYYEPFLPRWWYLYNLEILSSLAIAVADGVLTQHPNFQFYTLCSCFAVQMLSTIAIRPFVAGWENAWQATAALVNIIAVSITFFQRYEMLSEATIKYIVYAFVALLAPLLFSIVSIVLYTVFWQVDPNKCAVKSDRVTALGEDLEGDDDDERLIAELGGFLGEIEGVAYDPATGKPIDPATGLPLDPATGWPIDPATGRPIDPATGKPVDPSSIALQDNEEDDDDVGWLEWMSRAVSGAWNGTLEAVGLQESREEAMRRAADVGPSAPVEVGDNPGEIRTAVTMGARGGGAYADAPTGQVTVVDADRAKAVLAAGAAQQAVQQQQQQQPRMAAGPTAAGLVLQSQQQQQQQQQPAAPLASARPGVVAGRGPPVAGAIGGVPPVSARPGGVPPVSARPVAGGVPPLVSARPGAAPPGARPPGGPPPVGARPPLGVNPGAASAGPPPPLK